MQRKLFFAVLAAALTDTAGLGINCRGSSNCDHSCLQALRGYVNNIHPERYYYPGQHIACIYAGSPAGYCLFLQNVARPVDGASILRLVILLQSHGCLCCGSVPINYPLSNDPIDGILTSNYVRNTNGCDQLCS